MRNTIKNPFFKQIIPRSILLMAIGLTVISFGLPNICIPPAPDIVAWWPGDGNTNDIISGNNGTLQNGTSFDTGFVDQAFNLDGIDDYVSVPHNSLLQPSQITVTAWINADPTQPDPSRYLVVDKSHGFTDATGWALQGESSGGRIAFVYGNGSSFPEVFSTTNVLDNSWHFIVGTLDGITLKIYIDGSLEGSLPYTGTPAGNTRDVNIGASWGGGLFTRFFDGLIDEVTLYDRALSDAEILAIYNAGNAGKCKEVTCNNFPCGNNKVVVCHVPPGNPSNAHEICISVNAVKAHLNNHDDYCGPCDTSSKRYYEQVEYGEQVEYQLDDQSHLIQIYPNPFDGLIVLKIGSQNLTEKENLTFTMYDLLSKKVIQINNPKANRITLETSQLGSGLYFYQVTRAEKIIKIGKIIKQ